MEFRFQLFHTCPSVADFVGQTPDAATGTASIIVDNAGKCHKMFSVQMVLHTHNQVHVFFQCSLSRAHTLTSTIDSNWVTFAHRLYKWLHRVKNFFLDCFIPTLSIWVKPGYPLNESTEYEHFWAFDGTLQQGYIGSYLQGPWHLPLLPEQLQSSTLELRTLRFSAQSHIDWATTTPIRSWDLQAHKHANMKCTNSCLVLSHFQTLSWISFIISSCMSPKVPMASRQEPKCSSLCYIKLQWYFSAFAQVLLFVLRLL